MYLEWNVRIPFRYEKRYMEFCNLAKHGNIHRTKHSLNFDVNPYTFIENICQHCLVLRLVLGISEKASYFKPQFEESSPLVQVRAT